MEKLFRHKLISNAWNSLRPWVISIALFLLLRYTGLLAGISYLTGNVMMRSGVVDAKAVEISAAKKFNYNFSIKDLEGKAVHVDAFKGKTLFLNLWATWCGPCRLEMPSIEKLYQQVDHDKVMFIMLSIDRPQDFGKIKNYISEKEFTFPVYTPADFLPNQLQVKTIPATFIVSPDGRIVSNESGTTNFDTPEFKSFLESLTLP